MVVCGSFENILLEFVGCDLSDDEDCLGGVGKWGLICDDIENLKW